MLHASIAAVNPPFCRRGLGRGADFRCAPGRGPASGPSARPWRTPNPGRRWQARSRARPPRRAAPRRAEGAAAL